MAQAASGLNTATISRFEHDQSDISLKIAGRLMFNLGMGANDLGEMLATDKKGFPFGLAELVNGQRPALAAKITAYLQQDICAKPLAALIRQTLPYLQRSVTEDCRLPLTLEQQLADMLAYPEKWGNFEYYLITSVLPYASHELTSLCWQRLTALTGQTLGYRREALWRLGLTALLHDDTPLAAQIATDMAAISKIPGLQLHFNNVMPQFLAVVAIAKHKDLTSLLTALRRLGADQLAAFLARAAQEARTKPCWHNQVLKDHHDPKLAIAPDAKLMFGPTLGRLRKQRGLTVSDVLGDWSASAQSRFEHGKTQLGFRSTIVLMQRMIIPTSQMQTATDETSTFRRYRLKIFDMASNIKETHRTREDFERVLKEFHHTTPNLPKGLRVMYEGGLITVLHWAAPGFLPDSDALYASPSHDEQSAIVDYFRSLSALSTQDTELLNLNINRIDQTYYDDLITVILPHLKPQTNVAAQLYDNCTNFMYGAVYFHVTSVIPKLTAAFKHEPWLISWWPNAEVSELQTLAKCYQQDTPQTRREAEQLVADIRLLCPYDNSADSSAHWLTTYRGKGTDVQTS
ncbi:helix-turn-helix domain-containing protein [Lacticaseibacillus camelliae]|nr:helix-turn-helix domain-containing protein [Lacticaseibacillus camelliae]